jgi:hypothetical protein
MRPYAPAIAASFAMLAVEKRSAEFEVGAAAARGAGEGLAAAAGATGAGAPPIAFAMASAYERPAAYVSLRQHTPAYVSIRQHTSAYVSNIRQHTSAYVSIRQHTSERLLSLWQWRLRTSALQQQQPSQTDACPTHTGIRVILSLYEVQKTKKHTPHSAYRCIHDIPHTLESILSLRTRF